jgi:hypothetical protein
MDREQLTTTNIMININDRLKNYTHASDGIQFYLVSGSSGRHIDISQKMSIAILAKKDLSAAISDLFDRKCSLTRANLGVMELMTSDLAAEEKNFSTLLKSAEQKLATAKLCYRDEDRIELYGRITEGTKFPINLLQNLPK